MKHSAVPSTLALRGLLAACSGDGGNGNGNGNGTPGLVPDAFVASVAAVVATTADDTDPISIDSIAVTSPEDTDPDPVT